MEYLEFNKYQYGVRFMTVENLVPWRFGAIEVDDTIEQGGADLLSKNSRSLSMAVYIVAPVFKCLQILVSWEPRGLYSPFD